ncbi:MAG: ATP phosphoribosyltransferase [Gemmatimonadetes bacterium]|nr:ATP phosphoribosyltransferase [Gemmatimonadota bacterium]
MTAAKPITLALPKGRMFSSLIALLGQAGLVVKEYERSYRPKANDPRVELKILKPQNIPALVELGRHDLGFTGHDWIAESGCRVELLDDLGLEPVDIVAAATEGWVPPQGGGAPLVVASEYENLSRRFLEQKGWPYRFVRSYGATEVFPPEDADLIVDNSATGQTLRENGLVVVERLLSSSTRFIGSDSSLCRPDVRQFADDLVLLMGGVRAAESRVMLELNVANGNLDEVIRLLPAMKSPTVSQLADGSHVLKAAVPLSEVPRLVPRLKQLGASDILEYPIRKVIP